MSFVNLFTSDDLVPALQEALGYTFANERLLAQSLTHKSFANEQGPTAVKSDNERLEFLGDAVLDLALSEILMRRFPTDPEGSLSKKRASLVNEDMLASLALDLELPQLIRLGKGEVKTGGLQKPRILASTLEAIFGAIQVDRGYFAACIAIEKIFDSRLSQLGRGNIDFQLDYKTRLQEKIQERLRATPTYVVEQESGPDHDKTFEVSVRVAAEVLAVGRGRSKKSAEQDAARQALELPSLNKENLDVL